MAKYKCTICGYVHEGDSAPAQCPQCKQPADKFVLVDEPKAEADAPAPAKKKGIDTSSNVYTIIYAGVVVILVALLLATVSMALKERSAANERIDRMNQVLLSLNKEVDNKSKVEAEYAETLKDTTYVDGNMVLNCKVNGEAKYVLPLKGKGLWGGLWGYIAINDDMNTVYGVYFGHESETAGLGAEITNSKWKAQFCGKKLRNSNGAIKLSVVKAGKSEDGVEDMNKCDAVTGATLTSKGVDDMLNDCITLYDKFLTK